MILQINKDKIESQNQDLQLYQQLELRFNDNKISSIKIGEIVNITKENIEVKVFSKYEKCILSFKKILEKDGWIFKNHHNHPYTSIFVD
jgi:ASC-1-like (ASCH) protein